MDALILTQLTQGDIRSLFRQELENYFAEQNPVLTARKREGDRWLNLDELCDYLPDKPKKPTVYGWVGLGIIPVHKGTKKLRFLKSEIDAWIKQGKKKTVEETQADVDQYLVGLKNRR